MRGRVPDTIQAGAHEHIPRACSTLFTTSHCDREDFAPEVEST